MLEALRCRYPKAIFAIRVRHPDPQAYLGPPPRDPQLRLSASSLTPGEGHSLVPDNGFPFYHE